MVGVLYAQQPGINLSAVLGREPREPFVELGEAPEPHDQGMPYTALKRSMISLGDALPVVAGEDRRSPSSVIVSPRKYKLQNAGAARQGALSCCRSTS
jgi:hypothetical protein